MKIVHIKGDIDSYSKNSLSILITQDGLSYSIYDSSNNKMQALVSMRFSDNHKKCDEIKDFFNSEEIKASDYETINVVYSTKNTTIVPDVIFEEGNVASIYALNHRINAVDEILYARLPKSQCVIIYSVDKEIATLIGDIFPCYNAYPQSYSFIETGLTKTKISESPNRQRMLIQVFEDFFEVLVIDKTQIVNYNTYSYKSSNDILYFIINTFEQLGLSQNDCEIAISGFIEQDDLAVIHLKKFVQTVYFESINRDCKYFYRFQEFSPHYFYNFLNINL
ncbi:MAG: DUF3822 family protein [Bacteroidales bacterium]|nr:DUF3822 family protein [Bacteroidales bacterium]